MQRFVRLCGQGREAIDLAALNAQEFAGPNLPYRRGADQVERACLRRDHVAVAQLAEP